MSAVNNTNSQTTVYRDVISRDVYLMVNLLSQPGAGQQYQLWVIADLASRCLCHYPGKNRRKPMPYPYRYVYYGKSLIT
ncbi:hypothetical protein BC349_11130 [Flavihumibacter stibioxidans]|uniref:Uncharacterized protein n=1 Tax=Flavihumibacter stibioxidans TaxID=1834163 RepID=A0ABR7MAS5_9BACT|nr:hypothetical protein [Flavihumibacter stibioxidans]